MLNYPFIRLASGGGRGYNKTLDTEKTRENRFLNGKETGMKKFGVTLIIVGIILYALAALLGVTVRDDESIRALSRMTGITIAPENADALLAMPQANELSGTSHWMLSLSKHVPVISSAGIGCAGVGLLIILLSLIIKPILSIALLAAIAGVCYFAYQGNLGVSVQSFIQGVLQSIQDLLGRAIAWVRSAPQFHLL